MSFRLAIDADREHPAMYVIAWYGSWYGADSDGVTAEGDCCLGAVLEGDSEDVLEHNLASDAALKAAPHSLHRLQDRYAWASEAGVNKALKAARAALRAHREARKNPEMPAWAKRALAEGWKPPKGWKP